MSKPSGTQIASYNIKCHDQGKCNCNQEKNVYCGYGDREPEWFKKDEIVNHPKHYTNHASGVECIQVTEHFNFNIGNAIKYLWRSDLKGKQVEDLEKAIWYIKRELKRIKK